MTFLFNTHATCNFKISYATNTWQPCQIICFSNQYNVHKYFDFKLKNSKEIKHCLNTIKGLSCVKILQKWFEKL